jgi:hypothetical protein
MSRWARATLVLCLVLTLVGVVEPRALHSRSNSVLQTAHRRLLKQRVLQQQNSVSAVDTTKIEVISKAKYAAWLTDMNWEFGDAKSSAFLSLLAPSSPILELLWFHRSLGQVFTPCMQTSGTHISSQARRQPTTTFPIVRRPTGFVWPQSPDLL